MAVLSSYMSIHLPVKSFRASSQLSNNSQDNVVERIASAPPNMTSSNVKGVISNGTDGSGYSRLFSIDIKTYNSLLVHLEDTKIRYNFCDENNILIIRYPSHLHEQCAFGFEKLFSPLFEHLESFPTPSQLPDTSMMFSRSQNIHRDKKGRHIADYVIYDREIISPLLVVEVGFSQTNELLDEAREWFQKIDTVQAVIIMKIEEQNKYTAPSSNQAMTEEALKAQQRIWPQGGPYLVGGHEYLSRTSCNLQLHLKGEPKSYTMVLIPKLDQALNSAMRLKERKSFGEALSTVCQTIISPYLPEGAAPPAFAPKFSTLERLYREALPTMAVERYQACRAKRTQDGDDSDFEPPVKRGKLYASAE